MNNISPFLNGFGNNFVNNDVFNRLEMLTQEIKRLERRILNIEKNLIPTPPTPYNKIKPTPMENTSNYMNSNYSTDNYMI